MSKKYVIAFDIGTTGCRTILFDKGGNIIASSYQEFTQYYPKPGWVEHDAQEIWDTQLKTAQAAIAQAGAQEEEISGIGITNQRETVVVWDKHTGKPIMNAIVWQDRRTSAMCDQMKADGLEHYVKENTGLIIDAYFSGSKIQWILDNMEGARARAEKGELICGTIDSWMIWKLTGGKVHVSDYCNASRTMLFNIKTLSWDATMLKHLNVPEQILPTPRPSSEVYGYTDAAAFLGLRVPIAAAIGDQQGALFGQACFEQGMVKATYGTGGSLVMNAGNNIIHSQNGMLTSIAWGLDGGVTYSLEGLLYVVGAAVQWLRDELKIVKNAAETEAMAMAVPDTGGVYFVPAFVGLSAPYWDQYARGALLGITRGTNCNHIARAVLESMAYQIKDVLECMYVDTGIPIVDLKVDGGACKNNFLMQFQADLLNAPVIRPKVVDATARGAAFLAGLATGFWKDKTQLTNMFELDSSYMPNMPSEQREKLYAGWKKSVGRALDFEEH